MKQSTFDGATIETGYTTGSETGGVGMFQKDMRMALLLDFYGDILTERKFEIMQMYYDEDCSLSEIAEEMGISRQGVRDAVKRSECELSSLEDKLGLALRFEKLKGEIALIADEVSAVSDGFEGETKDDLERIRDRLLKLDI